MTIGYADDSGNVQSQPTKYNGTAQVGYDGVISAGSTR
jgi:hypothetical protein